MPSRSRTTLPCAGAPTSSVCRPTPESFAWTSIVTGQLAEVVARSSTVAGVTTSVIVAVAGVPAVSVTV